MKEDHWDKQDTKEFRMIESNYNVNKMTGVGLKTCTTCNKSYSTEQALKAHIKKKHLSVAQNLPCDICGKVLKFPWQLYDHRTRTHQELGTCPTCGLMFTLTNLKRHIRRTHDNERNFQCDICGKRFHYKSKVKSHKVRVHLNLKPFQCDCCTFTCASISNLNIHRKNRHGKKENMRLGDFPEMKNIFNSKSLIFKNE